MLRGHKKKEPDSSSIMPLENSSEMVINNLNIKGYKSYDRLNTSKNSSRLKINKI
jgi:hypothetical protein